MSPTISIQELNRPGLDVVIRHNKLTDSFFFTPDLIAFLKDELVAAGIPDQFLDAFVRLEQTVLFELGEESDFGKLLELVAIDIYEVVNLIHQCIRLGGVGIISVRQALNFVVTLSDTVLVQAEQLDVAERYRDIIRHRDDSFDSVDIPAEEKPYYLLMLLYFTIIQAMNTFLTNLDRRHPVFAEETSIQATRQKLEAIMTSTQQKRSEKRGYYQLNFQNRHDAEDGGFLLIETGEDHHLAVESASIELIRIIDGQPFEYGTRVHAGQLIENSLDSITLIAEVVNTFSSMLTRDDAYARMEMADRLIGAGLHEKALTRIHKFFNLLPDLATRLDNARLIEEVVTSKLSLIEKKFGQTEEYTYLLKYLSEIRQKITIIEQVVSALNLLIRTRGRFEGEHKPGELEKYCLFASRIFERCFARVDSLLSNDTTS